MTDPPERPVTGAERPVTGAERRVAVVSRAGCHLCEQALVVVRRVAGPDVEVLDVDTDPQRLGRWSEQVPVVLVDGRVHDVFRVEEGRLRRALEREPRKQRERWWRRRGLPPTPREGLHEG